MAPSVNEQLADRAAAHALDLVRFDSDARARVLGYLRQLEARLAEQLSAANLAGGMSEFRRTRAETLLRQVRETIAEAYADMADAAEGVLRGLAKVETASALVGVGKFVVETRLELNILTPAQLSRIVDATLIQGAPSRAWWQAQAGDLFERFSSEIREGVGLGETNDELVRRVRGRATGKRHVYEVNGKRHTYVEFRGGLMDTSTRHAEALVRTSVQSIAGQTRRDTFAENQDVVKGIVQVSTLDTRTTVTCRARAAKAWSLPDYQPIDHDIAYGGGTPVHWGCLPGDCLVTPRGRVSAASKRRFEGDLLVIRTASGRELPCTPNHPVLAGRGWVPARSLRIGDYVVCDGSGKRRGSVDGNHEQVPSRIENVASSFLGSRGVVAVPMPLSAEDFHGDARDGEVAVVGTDRFLPRRSEATRSQHLRQAILRLGRTAVLSGLKGRSHLALLIERARAAAHRFVGGAGQELALGGGGALHSGALLFGSSSRFQPALREGFDDGGDARPEALGDFRDSNAGEEHFGHSIRASWSASRPSLHAVLGQRSIDHLLSNSETLHKRMATLSGGVPARDLSRVNLSEQAARNYAAPSEVFTNSGDRDAELARDLRAGKSGFVELDEIVEIGRLEWHGHVYNLETAARHYVANGIITHNCRSTEAPLLRSWQELGIDLDDAPGGAKRWSRLDGKVPADFTMEQFLRRRSREQQDEMLGPGIAALWRARKVSLEELIDAQSGRPLALWEVQMRAAA